jgi:hypothetical protein
MLLKGLACTAQVDLAVPVAVTAQHCDGYPDSVPFPTYGPHVVGVGFVPPTFEVVVDFRSFWPPGSLAIVDELPLIDEIVAICVGVEVGADCVFSRPPKALEVVDELSAVDDVVVMLVEVEGALVGFVVPEVDVTVWHVDDTMFSAEGCNSREQECWMHDFAFGVNVPQVHAPFVTCISAQISIRKWREELTVEIEHGAITCVECRS